MIGDVFENKVHFCQKKSLKKIYIICIRFMQYIISAKSKFLQVNQFSEDNFSRLQRIFVPILCGNVMFTSKFEKHIY